MTEPGACGDPQCHVLHADPANPIHPPFYTDSRLAPCCQRPWPAAALMQIARGAYTHICGADLNWDGHTWTVNKLPEEEP